MPFKDRPKSSLLGSALFRLPLTMSAACLNLLFNPVRAVLSAFGGEHGTGVAAGPQGSSQPGMVSETELVRDTINGLIAFVVPGPDVYSIAQGMSTREPGGLDAGITDAVIASLNFAQPPPPHASPAALAAELLNQVALRVGSLASGKFVSPFACLSFAEKKSVLQYLETDPSMAQFRRLAATLLFLPAAAAYSEGGAFLPDTHRVVGWPIGWILSNYSGVSDGRDEFKGYFEGRREPLSDLCEEMEYNFAEDGR